jgi:hypothetical protein
MSLRGSADAAEGISLDELQLVVGQAQLSARGLLGGQHQDASFSLTDFPAVLLQPLFSALPALQVRVCVCLGGGGGAAEQPIRATAVVVMTGLGQRWYLCMHAVLAFVCASTACIQQHAACLDFDMAVAVLPQWTATCLGMCLTY